MIVFDGKMCDTFDRQIRMRGVLDMPIYEAKDYEKVIKRIRGKVNTRGIKMGECLSEDKIAPFENHHKVILSPAYRIFLKEVGNGCNHMFEGRRFNDLDNIPYHELSKPFMLEKFWLWEDDERASDIMEAVLHTNTRALHDHPQLQVP